jgi:hypothetical protein
MTFRLPELGVRRNAQGYIDPARLAIVIVGDRASIVRDLSGQRIRP